MMPTTKQIELLQALRSLTRRGVPPTMDMLGDHLEITRCTVYGRLRLLVEAGLVSDGEKRTRRQYKLTPKGQRHTIK
jgi:DNA-binding transcriptional ArsR family regulator